MSGPAVGAVEEAMDEFIVLDVNITEHPKFLRAGMRASWVWLRALCYSKRYCLEGFVPAPALEHFRATAVDVDLLVAVGLWECAEGGWRIHEFEQWQQLALTTPAPGPSAPEVAPEPEEPPKKATSAARTRLYRQRLRDARSAPVPASTEPPAPPLVTSPVTLERHIPRHSDRHGDGPSVTVTRHGDRASVTVTRHGDDVTRHGDARASLSLSLSGSEKIQPNHGEIESLEGGGGGETRASGLVTVTRHSDGHGDAGDGHGDVLPLKLSSPSAALAGRSPRARGATWCPSSEATDEDVAQWARQWRIPVDHPEFGKFLDYARDKDPSSRDWSSRWRNWVRRAPDFERPSGVRKAASAVQPVPATGRAWKPA
jgi:hypothetical protein